MKNPKTVHLGTRVSEPFYEVVRIYLERGSCLNESDLIRRALAYYLKNEVPTLYKETMGLR